jgi:hypothetical protein
MNAMLKKKLPKTDGYKEYEENLYDIITTADDEDGVKFEGNSKEQIKLFLDIDELNESDFRGFLRPEIKFDCMSSKFQHALANSKVLYMNSYC